MKKLFTFLIAAGSVTFASAQSSGNWHDERGSGHNTVITQHSDANTYKNNTSYGFSSFGARERDEQIQQINRDFDRKIFMVKRDRSLWGREKSRQIQMLE